MRRYLILLLATGAFCAFGKPDAASFRAYFDQPEVKKNYDDFFSDPASFEKRQREMFLTNNLISQSSAASFMTQFMRVYDISARMKYSHGKLNNSEREYLISVVKDESISGRLLCFSATYSLYLDDDNVDHLLKGLQANPFEIRIFAEIKDDKYLELINKLAISKVFGESLFTKDKPIGGIVVGMDAMGLTFYTYVEAMELQGVSDSDQKRFYDLLISKREPPVFGERVAWQKLVKQLAGKHNHTIENVIEVMLRRDEYKIARQILESEPTLKKHGGMIILEREKELEKARREIEGLKKALAE